MPQLTFTANATTNQLTITAHGLNTGDGPATPYTAAGTLPAPLVALTDYWIIRDDANNVRLATSQANAIAGTAVDLTTAGSGTLLLLIGVPYRRPRTYAAGSQLASADVNAWDDTFVALWNFLTGQAQTIWSSIVLAANQSIQLQGTGRLRHGTRTKFFPAVMGTVQPTGNNVVFDNLGAGGAVQLHTTGAANFIDIPICLEVGKRITAVRAHTTDDGTTHINYTLRTISNISVSNLSNTISTAGTSVRQPLNLTNLGGGAGFVDVVAGSSYAVWGVASVATTAFGVYGVEVDYIDP